VGELLLRPGRAAPRRRTGFPKGSRTSAIAKAKAFVDERLNGEDGLGAIFPAMANAVMMYDAWAIRRSIQTARLPRVAREAADRQERSGLLPAVPVAGVGHRPHRARPAGGRRPRRPARGSEGLQWLKPLQVLDVKGDWASGGRTPAGRLGLPVPQRPLSGHRRHRGGGDGHGPGAAPGVGGRRPGRGHLRRRHRPGTEWIEGLQSRNGGWGAFDADNVYHYLNNIPFADHGALLDPPTVDVAARCVSMLAQLGEPTDSSRMKAALAYLEREQGRTAAGSAVGASTMSMGPGRPCARSTPRGWRLTHRS